MSAFSVSSVCDSCKTDPFHFHTHSHAELIYVESGEILFECSGRKYLASAGDLLIIGRMENHGTHVLKEPYHRLCVNISYDTAADNDREHRLFSIIQNVGQQNDRVLHIGKDSGIDKLMSEIIAEYYGSSPCRDEMLSALAAKLLVTIYRIQFASRTANVKRINEKVLQIQQYIDGNFTENISVEKLAQENFMSPDHLTRCFKEMTGYSPKQYIIACRLQYARKLILSEDMSVKEAAFECGFCDVNHFIRSFKKYYNETPGKFMKHPY